MCWERGRDGRKENKTRKHPFRAKTFLLLFTTVFVVLPLCAYLLYLCVDMQDRVSAGAIENNAAYVEQISSNVNHTIELANYLTSSLMIDNGVISQLRALASQQTDEYARYLARSQLGSELGTAESTIMNANGGRLLFMAADGHVIASTTQAYPREIADGAQWLETAMQSTRITVFDPRLECLFSQVRPDNNTTLYPQRHLYFRRSIISYSGHFLGMIAVQLSDDGMWKTHRDPGADSRRLMIADKQGHLLMTQRDPLAGSDAVCALAKLSALTAGKTACGQAGRLYYHAIGLQNEQLVLLLAQPAADLFSVSRHITLNMVLLGCLFVLFSISSMVFIAHYFTKPLAMLAKSLETQDVQALHVNPKKMRFQEMTNLMISYNHAGKRIAELIDQVRAESLLHEKAKYESLLSQISPHFICNTVNAIKITAQTSGDEKAVEALTALGDILHCVYGRRADVVPIGGEMELLSSYIQIMRLRFGSTFQYVNAVPTELYRFQIPAFSLQPIVENAILHGLREVKAGQIVISAMETAQDITFFIFNNGTTPDPKIITDQFADRPRDKRKITGIGLNNVHTRVRMLYGAPYGLSLNTGVTVGCEVCLKIPRKETDDDTDVDR